MAGSRQPGPTCFYTSPFDVADGTSCLVASSLPATIGSATTSAALSGSSHGLAGLSHEQKMAEAIRRAYSKGLIADAVMRELPSVEQLVVGILVVGGLLA